MHIDDLLREREKSQAALFNTNTWNNAVKQLLDNFKCKLYFAACKSMVIYLLCDNLTCNPPGLVWVVVLSTSL